ncbi:meiotically up-regulated 71 protein [Coprinopsis marcescibilis]|uniref:Diphthine--ammonia ligase n=1 Tax=Coprinopsis marcescibilis TaxID=230819 RepID=A0A5C3L8M6_COPMA|nr:meiotically up-regulated 71 protein [Coprinopsis marcescibilis]
MKYVALLSGGKDSCYNLIHCNKNGHELIAAASLRPEPGKDELDSYMYQTVGQDAIEFVAQALDVPLYRRVISGDAVQQTVDYGSRSAAETGGIKGDETEDLYELLIQVLEHHPEVKGVSVGAILSNYQRVRVEHVCRRLGLTPLCYLWRRDQAELLQEMIEANLTAVLIKVAGIGLTTDHLGKTLAEMQQTLTKLNSLYGAHVCGEGGEYESLTIDCPLFKWKIVLDEVETVIHSDNGFATVAYLRIKKAHLESKLAQPIEATIPPLLEDEYRELANGTSSQRMPMSSHMSAHAISTVSNSIEIRSQKIGDWVAVSNVQWTHSDRGGGVSIADEVTECFHRLEEELRKSGLELVHCANINVYLSDMTNFAKVNAAYSKFFGTGPPARACVATWLPLPFRVRLDAIAYLEARPSDRKSLHVQGLSYWAPANIGPYSQAILAGEQIFVSGQIGLIPSSLILARNLPEQLALSNQHTGRIVDAIAESRTGAAQLILYWLDPSVEPINVLRNQGVPSLCIVVDSLPKGANIEKQVLFHTCQHKYLDEDGEVVVDSHPPTSTTSRATLALGGSVYIQSLSNYDSSSVTVVAFKGDMTENDSSIFSKVLPPKRSPLCARVFLRSAATNSKCQETLGRQLSIPLTEVNCQRISICEELELDCAIVFYSP